MKDVRSQGKGLSTDIFRCGHMHYLEKKTSDFSKFMVRPHGQGREDEPVQTFFGK